MYREIMNSKSNIININAERGTVVDNANEAGEGEGKTKGLKSIAV